MPITLIVRKQEYQIEGTVTVKQALHQLGFSTETHLAVKDGNLLNENEILRDGDTVKLIAVISGGYKP
jgi:sulfur carrier protein ThiS